MAEVWAKSNGNWSDTTLWAFWNETTQQIEDYGQTPKSGDIVYANGYTINVSNGFSFDGTFCNGHGSHTTNINGKIQIARGTIYIKTLICNGTGVLVLFHPSANGYSGTLNFSDAYCSNSYYYLTSNDAGILTLNGNIHCEGGLTISSYSSYTLTVNGNLYCETSCNIGWGGGTLYLNGTFENVYCNVSRQMTIVGNITVAPNQIFKTTNSSSSINGHIKYSGSGYFDFFNWNILNPNTITIKDISNSRSNPFIILTNADMNNTDQYPAPANVKKDIPYAFNQMVGTYDINQDLPPETVVLKDYVYDNGDKIGSLENQNVVGCVTPEDVRKDVPLVGMGVVGSLVVPSVDDVREGVVFDNGSVGTLIVQGGGDRLRIADFGYYTNAQSDTYIVDLTEQDKPKFAVAEERVLLEMFPELDLDNIPEKYFDDLFVKHLKYRLIVEYYRTAGINSTFTPSEPTTEIVNYQNVRNEVWLNSANIYLKAWAKKYPESIVKPQRILL